MSCLFLIFGVLFFAGPLGAQQSFVPQNQAQLQASFAPVVQHVVPSVVNVYAKRYVRTRTRRLPPLFDDPLFRRFFGDGFGGQQRIREQQSLGSGVIVDASGLVVTNNHVIEGGEELRVMLADRRQFEATLILADERTDLAVLRLKDPPSDLKPIAFRDSDNVNVGDLVLAIGNPFGVGQTVTSGIVSALARTYVGVSDYQSFIQTDAAINPGNSGGALVALDGRLLGVNTAIFSNSGGSVGIGFAIPANMVRQVVRAAQSGGKIKRPWIGARFQDVTQELADAVGLPRPHGALIMELHPQSPLKKAGANVGDVVLRVDSHDVMTWADMRYRIGSRDIGGRILMEVQSDDRQRHLLFDLVAAPETPPRNETVVEQKNAGPFIGVKIANLNPALVDELRLEDMPEGVIVIGVVRNSPAHRFGFVIGDIIRRINGQTISSVAQFLALNASQAKKWEIDILRGDRIIRGVLR